MAASGNILRFSVFASVAVQLTTAIDLQFYTEESIAFAVENGRGFVIIVLDSTIAAKLAEAVRAQRILVVAVSVTGVVLVNDPPAAGTGEIEAVVAGLAEGRVVVSSVLVPPDALAAAGTDHRGAVEAVRTEVLAVEFDELAAGIEGSARVAVFMVVH